MIEGSAIKSALGLDSFKYIFIQKIINFPQDFYILTLDSRHPEVFISMTIAKNYKGTTIRNLSNNLQNKEFKTTPPIELVGSSYQISSSAVFMVRDIAGEYYRNSRQFPKSYPDVKFKKKRKKKSSLVTRLATQAAMATLGMPGMDIGMFESIKAYKSYIIKDKIKFIEIKG